MKLYIITSLECQSEKLKIVKFCFCLYLFAKFCCALNSFSMQGSINAEELFPLSIHISQFVVVYNFLHISKISRIFLKSTANEVNCFPVAFFKSQTSSSSNLSNGGVYINIATRSEGPDQNLVCPDKT